jgi:RHS repeat-associated protein
MEKYCEMHFKTAGSLYYPKIQEVLEIPGNNTGDPLVLKTEYGYDSYGNVTSTKLTAPNYPGFVERVTTTQFGANYHHRFPTSQTNPAGYTSSMVYDPALGNVLSTKDPNNLETTYKQHPLGISSETVFPDKIKKMNVLRWASGHPDAPPNAVYYTWSQVSGTTEALTFFNKTGQLLRTVSYGFSGEKLYVDQLYYSSGSSNGRLHRISLPYKSGESAIYTTYTYDPIGRTTSIQYPDGSSSSTQYVGNKIVNTHEGQQSEQTYNAMGWLMESKDNLDKVVKNDYYSDGNLKQAYIDGALNTAVNLEYNSIGLRTKLDDPNYGVATSLYNPLGQLVSNTSPKNLTSTYQYDILGRMIAETNVEGTISWIYDETNGRKGTLSSVVSPQHSMSYVYDDLLRVTQSTEVINGSAYLTTTSYDAFNRVSTIDYPSGFSTMNVFNEQGNLYKIVNKADNTLLWQTDAVNSIGQITDYRTGNGLITKQTYHSTKNRLLSIHTAVPGQNPLQDLEFQWLNNGNLQHRKKWINRSQNNSLTERFTYDDVNRLEQVYLNNIPRGYHNYDDGGLGNIVYKRSDDKEIFWEGAYGQNNTGPHALTSFTTTDIVVPEVDQNITYSSFEKVTSITQGSKSLSIQYGFHRQRIEQNFTIHSFTKQKRWTGACEYIILNGHQTIHTYLSGPQGVYAIHVKHPNGNTEINYIHKDHLGSWHTITDQSGVLLQELSFDAWGQRRNPETWRFFTGAVPPPLFDRGFTGHEHLYAFDLINMNGRVYDPLVSRFLSPDPYIQAPDYSQSFNRYSYVFNNPLKYTDPSGEIAMFAFFRMAIYPFMVGSDFIANVVSGVDDPWGQAKTNASAVYNGMNNCLQLTVHQNDNSALTIGISPFDLGISANYTRVDGLLTSNVSGGIGLGGPFLNGGSTLSLLDFKLSAGAGLGRNSFGVGGSIKYLDWGAGLYSTKYSGEHSQRVGGAQIFFPNGSFRIENDFFPWGGDGFDRWRTSAAELEIGNFLIGKSVYTSSPDRDLERNRDYSSRFYRNFFRNGRPEARTYADSEVYSSPFYIGKRNGIFVTRAGINHPIVQDITQNGMHLLINSPLFITPYGAYSNPWGYVGYYNPFSLY